jgi:hypothetical protein
MAQVLLNVRTIVTGNAGQLTNEENVPNLMIRPIFVLHAFSQEPDTTPCHSG